MAAQLLNLPFLRIQPSKLLINNNKRSSFMSSCASTTPTITYDFDVKKQQLQRKAAKMELKLYNTMSKKDELFKPRYEGKVGMYVCGVIPYDFLNIGHARVYVFFDILFRYLSFIGYEVTYVRNFTDVLNDKRNAGEDPTRLSRRFCEEFQRDMGYLHCLPPTVEPRVSDHMPRIIDMIKMIFDDGLAYKVEGDVYFSVDKFRLYGQLSGCNIKDNRSGERVAVDLRKRNPADFALWKSAKEGEPFWESPWGPGRPGWYIECSGMSDAYLGETYYPHHANAFDILGGGMDLFFPHHENEMAQSCAAIGKSNIGYWIHNGLVKIDSQRMSKSLGNFFTVRQVIELYHPLVLRLFLIGTHYRSTINFSNVQLEYTSYDAYYIYQTLQDCEEAVCQQNEPSLNDNIPTEINDLIEELNDEFIDAMSYKFQSGVVLSAMTENLQAANYLLHTDKGKKEEMRIQSLAALEKTIRNVLDILGLMPASYHEVLHELREKALKRAKLTEDQIIEKINERNAARKNKEFERSQEIFIELALLGIDFKDSPEGTSWIPIVPFAMWSQYGSKYFKFLPY